MRPFLWSELLMPCASLTPKLFQMKAATVIMSLIPGANDKYMSSYVNVCVTLEYFVFTFISVVAPDYYK